MNKQMALYISSRLLSDAYDTYQTVQKGNIAVGVDIAYETLELFNRIADIVIDHYDREETVKAEMDEVKQKLAIDRVEYQKELDAIEEKCKDTEAQDRMLRKCAKEMCGELEYVLNTMNKYDFEDVREVYDYQIQTMRIMNSLMNDLV